ncbi:MAG: hypothetical protein IKJ26_11015 [Clostridia bacterium]|nr:hypothetical protein [Clostridia bacterium]
MTEFLAPLNYDRARDVLRRLSLYRNYSPEGARQAREVLRQHYPRIFERLESKTFDNGALLLEMPGANIAGPLVFVSHLDAPEGTPIAACPHELPMSVPLSRAHLVSLLEALEALLGEGYHPGGDLMLAISMDGLSGGAGAKSIADHLKARSISPCFVLDYGGYVTMDAFRTYLPKNAPLALVGVTEKGEMHGVLKADEAVCARRGCGHKSPVNELLRAAARMTRRPCHAKLCPSSEMMLKELAKKAPFLQRQLTGHPRLTFPLLRLLWRRRAIMSQFFWSKRTVYTMNAAGTPENPAAAGELKFIQTLIPGQKVSEYRHHLRQLAGNDDLHLTFHVENDASACSDPSGEAWDALSTAVEIQFDRVVIVPSLSPYVTDGRFYAPLGRRVYRFSPFMVTGEEALKSMCTVTDGTLQTAVQFFRSMLSV